MSTMCVQGMATVASCLMATNRVHQLKITSTSEELEKTCADIQPSESTKVHISDQQTFLSNEKNKSQFITLLMSRCLEADGQIVHSTAQQQHWRC